MIMKYKVEVDREKCIGCESCCALCDNFEIDKEAKARPKKGIVDELGCNKEAAESCPMKAIKITEIE